MKTKIHKVEYAQNIQMKDGNVVGYKDLINELPNACTINLVNQM